MTKIKDTFATLLYNLSDKYKSYAAASALFYWDSNHGHGLRIECVELQKEFVDNIHFGTDPEGFLFYNDATDFDIVQKNQNSGVPEVAYQVFYNGESAKAIQVDIYAVAVVTDKDKPIASFLAKDREGEVAIQTDALQNGKGKLRDLKVGTSSAEISSLSEDSVITLTMEAIRKKVHFELKEDEVKKRGGDAIYGKGIMLFPDLAHLTGSNCVVNYNEDRIIFYSSSDNTKLIAIFFPTAATKLKIDNKNDKSPAGATWEDFTDTTEDTTSGSNAGIDWSVIGSVIVGTNTLGKN